MGDIEKKATDELGEFLRVYNAETDRGAALVACSHFDQLLLRILQAYLLDGEYANDLVKGFAAPLGTFSSRIAICRSLGLIEKREYSELSLMRRIRNKFGHSLECDSFDSAPVRDLVDQLPWLGPNLREIEHTRRARFNFAAAILSMDLMYREHHSKDNAVTDREWPNKSR